MIRQSGSLSHKSPSVGGEEGGSRACSVCVELLSVAHSTIAQCVIGTDYDTRGYAGSEQSQSAESILSIGKACKGKSSLGGRDGLTKRPSAGVWWPGGPNC